MIFAFGLAALLATGAVSQTANPLAQDRSRHVHIPLTVDQKKAVVTEALTLFKIWCNRDSKASFYPAGSPVVPETQISQISSQIDTIATDEFNYRMSEIFLNVRDQHTNFIIGAPRRCFSIYTGVSLTFIESDDILNHPRVAVTGTVGNAAIRAALGPDIDKITAGDELLLFNGQTFIDYYKANQWLTGGANDFGGQRTALSRIFGKSGIFYRAPAEDTFTMVLLSQATGQNYTVKMNYASYRNDACWKASAPLWSNVSGLPIPSDKPAATSMTRLIQPKTPHIPLSPKQRLRTAKRIDDDDQGVKRETLYNLGAVKYNATSVGDISWAVYDPTGKNLGIIRLASFEPINSVSGQYELDAAMTAIRSLLVGPLKDTNSVVIDLRDNGGGDLTLANDIPQLFKPDYNPYGARYLRNSVSYDLLVKNSPPTDSWHVAWDQTKTGDEWSAIALFDPVSDANKIGQVYVKPAGILTDGGCYSACDTLSANMQTSGTAIVFGEDGTTGAGGANVWTHSTDLVPDATDFHELPFTAQLKPNYNNDMRTAFRQAVRNGKYQGQLIEDIGVITDIVTRARVADLLPTATRSTQFDRIADTLNQLSVQNGQNDLYFNAEPFTFDVFAGPLSFKAESSGFDKFDIYQADGTTLVGSQSISASSSKQIVTISLASGIRAGLGYASMTIVGSKNGKQFLKTKRNVRLIPRTYSYFSFKCARTFTLGSTGTSNLGVYTLPPLLASDGFNYNTNTSTWQVGNGVLYPNSDDSSLQLFAYAPIGSMLAITLVADYDTEFTCDFLYLTYSSANSTKQLITSVLPPNVDCSSTGGPVNGISGTGKINGTYTVATDAELFTIAVRFTSDPGAGATGVFVHNFSVTML